MPLSSLTKKAATSVLARIFVAGGGPGAYPAEKFWDVGVAGNNFLLFNT